MLHELVSRAIRACSSRPCFQVYGRASYEREWHVIDIFATHRRDFTSRWPLWRATAITWTANVIAVGWDFASWIVRDQRAEASTREKPTVVTAGRLRIGGPREAAGAGAAPTASEIMAHECGHSGQARRWSALYWPLIGGVTLTREGTHWWNHFENQASETGQFGGIVEGSVWTEKFDSLA